MTPAVTKRLKLKVLMKVGYCTKGKFVVLQPFSLALSLGSEELFAPTISHCTKATLPSTSPVICWYPFVHVDDVIDERTTGDIVTAEVSIVPKRLNDLKD